MIRRGLAMAVITLCVAAAVPAAAGASPQIVAAGLPEQCVVPQLVLKLPVASAQTLLMVLGCRVKVAYQASSLRRGRIVGVVGGLRSWPYRHIVTIVVSSGD
jgi:hypothetical protein